MTHTAQVTLTSPVLPPSSPALAKVALRKTIRQRSFYSLSANADRTDFAAEELDLVDAPEDAPVEAPQEQRSAEPDPAEPDAGSCDGCGGVEDVLDDWPMKVHDGLFIGSVMAEMNKPKLLKAGITDILQVAQGLFPHHPLMFNYMNIQVADSPGEDMVQHFPACFEFIDRAISQGGSVLVHCAAGVSRSATVVLGYLMSHRQLDLAAAVAHLKAVRPWVSPNDGFLKQLEVYQTLAHDMSRWREWHLVWQEQFPHLQAQQHQQRLWSVQQVASAAPAQQQALQQQQQVQQPQQAMQQQQQQHAGLGRTLSSAPSCASSCSCSSSSSSTATGAAPCGCDCAGSGAWQQQQQQQQQQPQQQICNGFLLPGHDQQLQQQQQHDCGGSGPSSSAAASALQGCLLNGSAPARQLSGGRSGSGRRVAFALDDGAAGEEGELLPADGDIEAEVARMKVDESC